jgi:hypothetical protein
MPKIYVAVEKADSDAKKLATGSMTIMKTRLREFPDTLWTINTIQIKADVPTICGLIEGADTPVESSEDVRVNASGQVRTAK